MKGTDRFLMAIVAGALLIAVAAAGVTLLHRGDATYRPEDTPEGVAFNYILALQRGDYARAYGYLSPTLPNYPRNVETFISDMGLQYGRGSEANAALAVDPANLTGDLATVAVRETSFYSGGLFGGGESTQTYNVLLRREEGAWKVRSSGGRWGGPWQSPG